jgi:hypothetical protein
MHIKNLTTRVLFLVGVGLLLGCERRPQQRPTAALIGVYYPQGSSEEFASRLDDLALQLGYSKAQSALVNPMCCAWFELSSRLTNGAEIFVSEGGVFCSTTPDYLDDSCDTVKALLQSGVLQRRYSLKIYITLTGGPRRVVSE